MFVDMWEQDDNGIYLCYICKNKMPYYKIRLCCSGHECGCYGLPVDPPVCSGLCFSFLTRQKWLKDLKDMNE